MALRNAPLKAILIATAAFILTFSIVYRFLGEEDFLLQQRLGQKEILREAKELLTHSKAFKTLELLKEVEPHIFSFPDLKEEWWDLALETAIVTKDDKLLFSLYRSRPEIASTHEQVALSLARLFLLKGDLSGYRVISREWEERPHKEEEWLLLEADALILAGNSEKAIAFLRKEIGQGEVESQRLLRLALLSQNEHPKNSWNYLSEALKKGFFLSELHYYRAQYLKGINQDELATLEFEQAVKHEDKDPFYKEELIKHYWEKQKLPSLARFLEAQKSLSPPLLKQAYFLSKIYRPLQIQSPFFVENGSLESRWLELIQTLKEKEEFKAYQILLQFPEMATYGSSLYKGLLKVLGNKFPENGSLKRGLSLKEDVSHPLFQRLDRPPYSNELLALIDSEEKYAALFLAAGWHEAALTLQEEKALSPDIPRWVAYGFTEALAKNRSVEKALHFAKSQPSSAQLLLLIGELYSKSRQNGAALKIFKKLSSYPGALGAKATQSLGAVYLQEGNLGKAKESLLSHKEFSQTVDGKQMLAEIEWREGHYAKAEAIYREIAPSSSVAKSFLAAKAYQRKEYGKARRLLIELIKEFPYRNDLKDELALILEKEELSKSL